MKKCKCKCEVPVSRWFLSFTDDWGVFTWLMTIIMAISTGGLWIIAVLLWNIRQMVNSPWRCDFCDGVVDKKNIQYNGQNIFRE